MAMECHSQEAHRSGNTIHPPAFDPTIYDGPRSLHEQGNEDLRGRSTVEDLPEELPSCKRAIKWAIVSNLRYLKDSFGQWSR